MIYAPLALPGAMLITPERTEDARGYFMRLIDYTEMRERGLQTAFSQESVAFNEHAGTLRGLHYQLEPFAETKLVRCIRGRIYDVLVDLRRESSTFGRWTEVNLDAAAHATLYVPRGIAHGYQTLEPRTEVWYRITPRYEACAVAGIHYADPALAIPWPIADPIVSERDQRLPPLA